MKEEEKYVRKRIWKSKFQSLPFYICRIFKVKRKKIVFCCIEGTTGYTCNPKYIAEELIRRNSGYELVWLVNDMSRKFPSEIRVVHNTLFNRAYHLTTAKFWIDNSRKQLEVRKRTDLYSDMACQAGIQTNLSGPGSVFFKNSISNQ